MFSSPDDFSFHSFLPVKKYIETKNPDGIWKLKNNNGLFYYERHEKRNSPGYSLIFTSDELLYEKDFVLFLKETYDVVELNCEPVIQL